MNSNKVILCVDDEKIVLTSLKSQLKQLFGSEYIYETADNPNEAIDLVDELITGDIRVLVIVSDWLMPEMKGDEMLKKIHDKHPFITKILITGQANKKSVDSLFTSVNLHHCINKPWTEKELFETLKSGILKAENTSSL